ncbi:DUF4384 domain-containing protein [Leisingera methylohalidivorans]|uniref:Uncharacterized protein n=1 Tax=Leisingera methylohalidivorans DSM 14336 TaxID=999552 RepID=V9W1H9_9RHOB|nr:DUF4384 domain-containing protein [Leisingera methylohalidivorans]AHD03804.1 hypothetical protein METH_23510 [Leisingera methylohalidivorans DSM 14336]
MMRPPAIWALGLAGSALVHAAGAGALLISLAPDPVPQQPAPESSLNLEAHRIPRSEARPQAAESEQAPESAAQSQGLSAGAVPQSRARAQAPAADRLAAAAAPAASLTAAAAQAAAALPAQVSENRLASAEAPAPRLSAARPDSQQAQAAEPAPENTPEAKPAAPPAQAAAAAPILLAAAQDTAVPLATAPALVAPAATAHPTPAALPQTAPASQPSPEAQPETAPLAGTEPRPQHTPAATPDAPRIKAALAFQGGAGDIDPTSLAAFQAFVQPGDAVAESGPLRDGVAGILAAVPCSRLQVAFVPETATLEVRGHLPEDGLRAPVLAALQARMGADIMVSDQMRLLPRPQCGALAGISGVGLPQSTDQITNPLLVGADAHARVLDYSGGERLFFDLTAPDYPAYVYVDYFDAGGAVLHLAPDAQAPLAETAPESALRVGAREAGDPGLQITVGPPYGQEIAVAFAASHPLYADPRPLSEPAAPYLEFLRAQVAQARTEHLDFKGEWVYFLITTHAP